MSAEKGPSGGEIPEPILPLLRVIGEIALAHDIDTDEDYSVASKASVATAIAHSGSPEELTAVALMNINAGFDSVLDNTGFLDVELNRVSTVLELDAVQRESFKNALVTQISRLLHERTDLGPAIGISDEGDVEPTRYDLEQSEAEFEKLAHVPLSADAQTDYMRKFGRHELLNAAEEVELARKIEVGVLAEERLMDQYDSLTGSEKRELQVLIREGARAKEEMFTANLRLVVNYTRRYSHKGMGQLDLIQEGNIGLLHAIEKFDFKLGYKFSTYATWWLKQAMTRAIHDKSTIVRLPVHIHERIDKMMVAKAKVEAEIGRSVTDTELSEALDMPLAQVKSLTRYAQTALSLNAPIGDDGHEFGDLLPATDTVDPLKPIEQEQLQLDVSAVLASLDDQSANIIRLRLGIGYDHPRTLEDVADIMGMRRIDVRKIESRAMRKLKDDESMGAFLESQRWA